MFTLQLDIGKITCGGDNKEVTKFLPQLNWEREHEKMRVGVGDMELLERRRI